MIRMPGPSDDDQYYALSPYEIDLLRVGGVVRLQGIGHGMPVHLSVVGTTPLPRPLMRGGEQEQLFE